MRQSASMAEISEESSCQEEEGEEASAAITSTGTGESGGGVEGEGEGEGEAMTDGVELGKESGSQETSSAIDDSDSDTEEEEEDEKVGPASVGVSSTNNGAAQPASPAHQNPGTISSSSVSSGAAQTTSPSRTSTSSLSAITVTEAPVPPGTPPLPGRCISVSSPGRGHKIFMVTRVESPPEQPSLLAQLQAWKEQDRASQTQTQSLNQTKPSPGSGSTSKDTPAAKPAEAQSSLGGGDPSPAPSGAAGRQADSHLPKEENPVEQVTDPLGVLSVEPNPPALQSQQPPAETDSSVTLDKQPNMASTVAVKEDLKESSQEMSAEPKQPTSEGQTTAVAAATPTPNTPEQQPQADPNTHTQPQPSTDALTSPEQVPETQSGSLLPAQACEPIAAEQKASQTIPEPTAQEQQPGETAQESEQKLHRQQQTLEECGLPSATSQDGGKSEATVALERPVEKPDSCSGSEQLSSGQTLEEELEAELEVAEQELKLVSGQQTQPHYPPQPAECPVDLPASLPSLEAAATTTPTPAPEQNTIIQADECVTVTRLIPDVPQAEESSSGDSPDESSTDDGESATAELSGAALPNGLKPEFALHLLDPEGPKPGSCVMEHGGCSSPPHQHWGAVVQELWD